MTFSVCSLQRVCHKVKDSEGAWLKSAECRSWTFQSLWCDWENKARLYCAVWLTQRHACWRVLIDPTMRRSMHNSSRLKPDQWTECLTCSHLAWSSYSTLWSLHWSLTAVKCFYWSLWSAREKHNVAETGERVQLAWTTARTRTRLQNSMLSCRTTETQWPHPSVTPPPPHTHRHTCIRNVADSWETLLQSQNSAEQQETGDLI